jgi:hypothetical protein
MAEAALGFSVHTGWSAVVAVTGPVSAPRVLDRRRIELIGSTGRGSAFVYHAARELDAVAAELLITSARTLGGRLAESALAELLTRLTVRGDRVVAAGIPVSGGKPLPPLPDILRSHSLVHSAEGALFRQVLVEASAACGLRVEVVSRRDLAKRAAAVMGVRTDALVSRLAALGKALGPPWAQDQKDAALAALIALAGWHPPGG